MADLPDVRSQPPAPWPAPPPDQGDGQDQPPPDQGQDQQQPQPQLPAPLASIVSMLGRRGFPSPLSALASQVVGPQPVQRPPPGPMVGRGPPPPPAPPPGPPPGPVPPGLDWARSSNVFQPRPDRPIPPLRIPRFIASMPDRHFSQWGTPEQFPMLPNTWELPGIYQAVGQFFQQHGSAGVSPLGGLVNQYSAAYQKAFIEGQEARMRLSKEKLSIATEELELKQARELHEYSDIVSEYAAAGDDPLAPSKTLGGKGMLQALYEKAAELGDRDMINILEGTGSVASAMKFQQDREAKWRDLNKANTKASDDAADAELWGLTPHGQSDTSVPLPRPFVPPKPGEEEAKPPKKPGEPDDQSPDAEDSPLHEEAVSIFKGVEPGAYLPAAVKRAAALESANMKKEGASLLHSDLTGDALMKAVKKTLGGSIADDLQNYADYRRGPGVSGQSSGGKEQDYWNFLGDLAHKMRPGDPAKNVPGWSQSNFQAIARFKDSPQLQNTIGRIATITTTGDQVLNDLDNLPKDLQSGQSLKDVFTNISNGTWTGDQRYVALYNDWLKYNQETNVLIRGGQGGVTETEASVEVVPRIFGNPSAYRTVVVHDAEIAAARLAQYHNQWQQYGSPDPMPGSNPEQEAELNRIRNIEPINNLNPGDTVTGADGVTRKWMGSHRDQRDNWEIVR